MTPFDYNSSMSAHRQLDLFAISGVPEDDVNPVVVRQAEPPVSDLSDAALILALPAAGLATCRTLAEEASRRGLVAAVPALETLSRRFKGFGLEHVVPEQAAALRALGVIGGVEAAAAVVRIIVDHVVQGPGLRVAVAVAAALRCRLPGDRAMSLLRHPDPDVRRDATRCARPQREVIDILIDLLQDLNRSVAVAAACALGHAGRTEARPLLVRLLQTSPSAEVIDAVAPIADEACVVVLGRIGRLRPDLLASVLAALNDSDDTRAITIVQSLQRVAPQAEATASGRRRQSWDEL